jgi:hypothetical protein
MPPGWQIAPHKRACVYEYRVNSLVAGNNRPHGNNPLDDAGATRPDFLKSKPCQLFRSLSPDDPGPLNFPATTFFSLQIPAFLLRFFQMHTCVWIPARNPEWPNEPSYAEPDATPALLSACFPPVPLRRTIVRLSV